MYRYKVLVISFACLWANIILAGEGMPPQPVQAIELTQSVYNPVTTLSANLRAERQVEIRAEAPGKIIRLPQPEGMPVKDNDALVIMDDAEARADYDRKRAKYEMALLEYDRLKQIEAKGSTSQSAVDNAYGELKQSIAEVAHAKAVADKMLIRAPFAGQIGLYRVNVGQVVAQGELISYLVDNQSLRVEFFVPQAHASQITPGLIVSVPTGQDNLIEQGTVAAIEPRFDPVTHQQQGYALIDNQGGRLRSGMSLPVSIVMPSREALLVPLVAITEQGTHATAFVIESGQVVQRHLATGAKIKDQVEIIDGLAPGDWLITAGQHKLMPGMSVVALASSAAEKTEVAPEEAAPEEAAEAANDDLIAAPDAAMVKELEDALIEVIKADSASPETPIKENSDLVTP